MFFEGAEHDFLLTEFLSLASQWDYWEQNYAFLSYFSLTQYAARNLVITQQVSTE